jgi:hypothetical protein
MPARQQGQHGGEKYGQIEAEAALSRIGQVQ